MTTQGATELARRRLDLELVKRGLAESRAAAQRAIDEGIVEVAGVPAPKPATLVTPDATVRIARPGPAFVSRGGHKLDGAVERMGIRVDGRRAVDVGASTGGFTDCLLQRSAASVVAIDVGYGQFDWSLRSDPRVTVFERTNIRHADPGELGAPFDIVVADLSFIGLRLVAPQIAALGSPDADWMLLVKPQFEAGRDAVGAGGVVRDPKARADAVSGVAKAFWECGIGTAGVIASALEGAKSGNREFFVWLRRDAPQPRPEEIALIVSADG